MSYKRRYYLHRRCKKAGLILNARAKQISVSPQQTTVALTRKYIIELSEKYNYGIQFTNPILDL